MEKKKRNRPLWTKVIIKTVKCTDFVRRQSEFYLQQTGTIKYIYPRPSVPSGVPTTDNHLFLHTGRSEPTPLPLSEGLMFVERFSCVFFSPLEVLERLSV